MSVDVSGGGECDVRVGGECDVRVEGECDPWWRVSVMPHRIRDTRISPVTKQQARDLEMPVATTDVQRSVAGLPITEVKQNL